VFADEKRLRDFISESALKRNSVSRSVTIVSSRTFVPSETNWPGFGCKTLSSTMRTDGKSSAGTMNGE
jgi:hypothetical protein